MKKLWIITDICHLELYDPNRFHFASVSTSRLWVLSWSCGLNFQCVYHLCITKVGQMQQRLCTCISKTEPQPSVQGKMSVPRLFAGQLSSGIVSRKVCFCNIAISSPICGFPVAWINFKCSLLTVQKKNTDCTSSVWLTFLWTRRRPSCYLARMKSSRCYCTALLIRKLTDIEIQIVTWLNTFYNTSSNSTSTFSTLGASMLCCTV